MKKNIFKIVSTFIIISSLFCGCASKNEANLAVATSGQDSSLEERASEYKEDDNPWGEHNYKKVGVIVNIQKNLNENYTTALLTIDDENTKDNIKIYGTDINISDYNGQTVFITGVKDDDVSRDYVLIKSYEDIRILNRGVIESIKSAIKAISSLDNDNELNEVKNQIELISDTECKDYIMEIYNAKINELTEKKKQEEALRKAAEEEAKRKAEEAEEAKRKAEEEEALENSQTAQPDSNSNNSNNNSNNSNNQNNNNNNWQNNNRPGNRPSNNNQNSNNNNFDEFFNNFFNTNNKYNYYNQSYNNNKYEKSRK